MNQIGYGIGASGILGLFSEMVFSGYLKPEALPFLPMFSMGLVVVGTGLAICGEIRRLRA